MATPPNPAETAEALKFFDWAYKNGGKMAADPRLRAAAGGPDQAGARHLEVRHQGYPGRCGQVDSRPIGNPAPRVRAGFTTRRPPPGGRPPFLLEIMNTAAVAFDSRHAAKQRFRENLFRGATLVAALLVLLLLGGVALSLLHGSWPAFSHFKFAFLTRENLESGYGRVRRPGAGVWNARHPRSWRC